MLYAVPDLTVDTTVPTVTTPLAISVPGTAFKAARIDHTHQSPGGIAAITASSAGINSTETIVVSATIPANFIKAGTTFRVRVWGTCTSSAANTGNFRIRFGPNGNNTDTQLIDLTTTAAASGTNIPFFSEFDITFQSTTVAEVAADLSNNGTTGVSNAVGVVAAPVNTTALTTTSQEILSMSFQASAATTTCTFTNATIEVVKM